MDALIFAANIMYVIAYFTTDLLRLRLLSVTGAIFLAVYFYAQPEPLWSVIGWNLFFVSLNVFQIVRILNRRKHKGKPGATPFPAVQ
jgi:hypothetical protein